MKYRTAVMGDAWSYVSVCFQNGRASSLKTADIGEEASAVYDNEFFGGWIIAGGNAIGMRSEFALRSKRFPSVVVIVDNVSPLSPGFSPVRLAHLR